jgi:large subunit ribosomal protein L16
MLQPLKVKWRKKHKGRNSGKATAGCNLSFGDFGLMAMTNGFITSRQIEAARVAISRNMHRGGKMWVRIFPDKPITKKPVETRMGKGKGAVEGWVAPIKRGRMLFEIEGIKPELAAETLRIASHKLPVKTKLIGREGYREA